MRLARRSIPILAALLASLAAGAALASDSPEADRNARRVATMEKALDHMLLDSPNFLVQRGRNAHGVRLPDYGVVFTFNAQLNLDDTIVEAFDDDHDSRLVVRRGSHRHAPFLRFLGVQIDHRNRGREDDPLTLYQDGREELVELLLDEAGILGKLPDGQWVVISALVDDDALRHDRGIQRLVLRVRTDDLRAFAEGRLDEAATKARIQADEL
jgi:hypothetical protein